MIISHYDTTTKADQVDVRFRHLGSKTLLRAVDGKKNALVMGVGVRFNLWTLFVTHLVVGWL